MRRSVSARISAVALVGVVASACNARTVRTEDSSLAGQGQVLQGANAPTAFASAMAQGPTLRVYNQLPNLRSQIEAALRTAGQGTISASPEFVSQNAKREIDVRAVTACGLPATASTRFIPARRLLCINTADPATGLQQTANRIMTTLIPLVTNQNYARTFMNTMASEGVPDRDQSLANTVRQADMTCYRPEAQPSVATTLCTLSGPFGSREITMDRAEILKLTLQRAGARYSGPSSLFDLYKADKMTCLKAGRWPPLAHSRRATPLARQPLTLT